jgi:hypothetical protein
MLLGLRIPRLRLWALALVLIASGTWRAGAAPLDQPIPYETAGSIGQYGLPDPSGTIEGAAVIRFQGQTDASFTPSSPFSLGDFVVAPAAGGGTTYVHTPFEIELRTPEFDRIIPAPLVPTPAGPPAGLATVIDNSVVIRGFLDGTVAGSGRSDVVATLASIAVGPAAWRIFAQDDLRQYAFPFPLSELSVEGRLPLTTTSGAGGRFALAAEVLAVPEPTVLCVTLIACAGWTVGRRVSAGRWRARRGDGPEDPARSLAPFCTPMARSRFRDESGIDEQPEFASDRCVHSGLGLGAWDHGRLAHRGITDCAGD